jgi:hypothetical protein
MDLLVGYTGFVGSNLCNQHKFDLLVNSKNIEEAFDVKPDLCVYAGIRAEKFFANHDPQRDLEQILNAIENIKRIKPKRIVLISTVDVYKYPVYVNESDLINTDGLSPYGLNRYKLEEWVKNNTDDHLIIRLPALFGKNIRKNFIYDILNPIPSVLNESKYNELRRKDSIFQKYYFKQDNGFYKAVINNNDEQIQLKNALTKTGFSSLYFTDSRAVFQFYNLEYLWEHIQASLSNALELINFATEPLWVGEICCAMGMKFKNEMSQNAPLYDFRTLYDFVFKGKNGYIMKKETVLRDIVEFVSGESFKLNNSQDR